MFCFTRCSHGGDYEECAMQFGDSPTFLQDTSPQYSWPKRKLNNEPTEAVNPEDRGVRFVENISICLLFTHLTLNMETVFSSETSGNSYQTT
jgi:hypothetical protein